MGYLDYNERVNAAKADYETEEETSKVVHSESFPYVEPFDFDEKYNNFYDDEEDCFYKMEKTIRKLKKKQHKQKKNLKKTNNKLNLCENRLTQVESLLSMHCYHTDDTSPYFLKGGHKK